MLPNVILWGHSRAVLFLKWHRYKRRLDKQKQVTSNSTRNFYNRWENWIPNLNWKVLCRISSLKPHSKFYPCYYVCIYQITGLSHRGFLTYTHIDLSHLESEDTLNIHMQTCILGKMLMYSHFSSTLPKTGQRICSKTGLQLWGEKMHKLRLTTNYILWDIQIILRLFRSLHKSKLKQVSNYLHSSIIQ